MELGPKNSCSPMCATIPTSQRCQRVCGEVQEQERPLVFCVRHFPAYPMARLMKTSGVQLFSFKCSWCNYLGEASIIPSDAPIICMREFGCRERLFLFLAFIAPISSFNPSHNAYIVGFRPTCKPCTSSRLSQGALPSGRKGFDRRGVPRPDGGGSETVPRGRGGRGGRRSERAGDGSTGNELKSCA